MTSSEIRSSIYRNEYRIDECRSRITDIERQINELEQLRIRIDTAESRFSAKQAKRLVNIGRIALMGDKNRTAARYAAGMNDLISGGESRNVIEGLEISKRKVTYEINSLEEQKCMFRNEIAELNSENSSLYYQYSNALEAEQGR